MSILATRKESDPEPVSTEDRDERDASSVQLRGETNAATAARAANVRQSAQSVANEGVAGSEAELPFADEISASFGRHDLSSVSAHTDGAAKDATGKLGAEAYATGDSVAFGKTPSLHTTAHEAAHVIQQRAGVQLKGGVGEAGDVYETQADAIADRVVAKESAEDLLDQAASGAGGSTGVQRREAASSTTVASAVEAANSEANVVVDRVNAVSADVGQPLSGIANTRLAEVIEMYNAALAPFAGLNDTFANDPDSLTVADVNAIVEQFRLDVAEADTELAAVKASMAGAVTATYEARDESRKVLEKPRDSSFGEVAAAHSDRIRTGHHIGIIEHGKGTHHGNMSGDSDSSTRKTDCVTNVMDVIGSTFRSFGRGSDWDAIKDRAYELSKTRGSSGLTGIDLQTALIELAGWKAIFVAADLDPNSEENKYTDHHIVEHGMARGKQRMFGNRSGSVPGVRPSAAVGDYSPGPGSGHEQNELGLEQIRSLPFGFACASGGMHTAMVIEGVIHDCHWDMSSEEALLFEEVPIESWPWRSALIAVPGEDVDRVFGES